MADKTGKRGLSLGNKIVLGVAGLAAIVSIAKNPTMDGLLDFKAPQSIEEKVEIVDSHTFEKMQGYDNALLNFGMKTNYNNRELMSDVIGLANEGEIVYVDQDGRFYNENTVEQYK